MLRFTKTELRTQRHKMFEQTFKNLDDTLWKDAGCGTELDYIEQTSWVLFLKWLDDYEKDRETAASGPDQRRPSADRAGQQPAAG